MLGCKSYSSRAFKLQSCSVPAPVVVAAASPPCFRIGCTVQESIQRGRSHAAYRYIISTNLAWTNQGFTVGGMRLTRGHSIHRW